MPIIDQCDGPSGRLNALSSALEIFDKFKTMPENEKYSDSEESFHLPLDDDDAENQSMIYNGKDKDSHKDDAEADILNDDLSSSCPESNSNDAVLEESAKRITRNSVADSVCKKRKKTVTDVSDDSSAVKVKLTFNCADYETNCNGEFRSYYEADQNVGPNNKSSNTKTPKKTSIMEVDIENKSTTNSVASFNSETSSFEETSTDDLLKQLDESINSTSKNVDLKIAQKSELTESKKNLDQPDEDDADLLDISMIRETEEDDACAIAEAIQEDPETEDAEKDAHTGEKFDHDAADKVEQEQESSDGDKDNDNDNDEDSPTQYQLGYDEIDEDTRGVDVAENSISGVGESDNQDSNNGEDSESRTSDVQSEKKDDMEVHRTEQQKESIENEMDNLKPDECATENCLDTDFNNVTNKTELASEKINESVTKISNPPDVIPLPDVPREKTSPDSTKIHCGKRSLSSSDITSEINPKKAKLADTITAENIQGEADSPSVTSNVETKEQVPISNDNVKTLSSFAKFMQFRKLSSKLSRSDLEQFCIQKICECLMLRSTEGELHQTIKKQQKSIEGMRKDLQQLIKQSKDLEIVNKRLMNELKVQSVHNKPLVPLKITRSVGLQVRLNPGSESPVQMRRRQPLNNPPPKQVAVGPVLNKNKPPSQPPSVVRQILPAPSKPPVTSSQTGQILSQVLQQNNRKSPMPVNRRNATITRKPPDAATPSTPGVIDLTDEDEKLAANRLLINSAIKINKTVSSPGNSVTINKISTGKSISNQVNQAKVMGQQKSNKPSIPSGIRLTSGSVISSGTNGSQMLYVVPTISSNGGSAQKLAFVNFQPTNGVLTGALSSSTVSVVNKGQTLTLKSVPTAVRKKHPAPLPALPRITSDPSLKPVPPKPHLTIKKIDIGIILQWKMPYNLDLFEDIASYQLYAYQETSAPPNTEMWRKVGDVKALALPMACTLTQFADKNKYYFAVRSVDVHKRIGAFSDPEEISL
ncbi:fibronectin-III type domain-containing protein windei [Rhynchophorus ferrugineus]|uniref:fibronectin-III type domain-containing protein windei n=1 Tax=Rhynchophorus ferrugineus TaxID=354439 RepID=UPI003FCC944A